MSHLHSTRPGFCLAVLLLLAQPGRTADPPKIDLDELAPHPDLEWLRRAKVPTDDVGLAKFLAGLRGPEPDPAEVDRLVTQLRTGSKAEQDAAGAKLAEIGAIAVSVLRRHRLDADPAAAARVRACLAKIEEAADKPLARPAMRRLVRRNAPGAAEALLGYVPFAFDPEAELDAWYGLDELAARDPKVLSVLASALADKQPARRGVAACILGRRGDTAQKKAVAGLLADPDPMVRLRAAQGPLAGKDTVGVPALIELLADAGVEVRWQAEELLRWLAVDTAPDALVGAGDAKTAEACRAAWRKWWTDQGQKADVAAAEREPRRPLLLLAYDRKGGRAWVVGCDGATRHEWTGLERLADAQYVPGGGVLTLHEQPVRGKPLLAERDLSGKVLWQHDNMADPQYCQRLSNGRVFVAERQDIAEPYLKYQVVAPGGRIVATQPNRCSAPARSHAFRMMDDGRIATSWMYTPPGTQSTRFNTLEEYDPATNTTRKLWATGHLAGEKVYLESNLDGGYLLSGHRREAAGDQRVTAIHEYDWDGDTFWKYEAAGLVHAVRLHGGTTIGCADGRMIEISDDRRQVGEIRMEKSPDATRPCLALVRFGFDTFPTDIDLETDVDYRARCLKKKDPKDRIFALRHLADFRFWGARAIPTLQAHGEERNPEVRKALHETLKAVGAEEIPKLHTEAKDPNPDRRAVAVSRLGGYRNGPGVLDALLNATKDDSANVRWAAVRAFENREPNPQTRRFYTDLPGSYREAADRIVPALMMAIKDPDDRVRQSAMRALGLMGDKAKAAIPALIGILKNDTNKDNRSVAAMTLGEIGDDSPEVEAALYSALKDAKYPWTRRMASSALSHLRPVPKRAGEWFLETYRTPGASDPKDAADIRSTCLYSLARIKAADPVTLALMKDALTQASGRSSDWIMAAHYLITVPEERVATFKFLAERAEQETDPSLKQSLKEQVRQLKMILKKQHP